MTIARAAVAVAIALAAACAADPAAPSPAALPPAEAAALLIDRNWMDRWPTDARQRLEVYRFTPAMGGGVYQDRTLFAGHFELMTFDVVGDRLRLAWPDRDLVEEIGFRVTPVDGPPPFDLRLDLDGNAIGPRALYGRRAEGAGAAAITDVERALSR